MLLDLRDLCQLKNLIFWLKTSLKKKKHTTFDRYQIFKEEIIHKMYRKIFQKMHREDFSANSRRPLLT